MEEALEILGQGFISNPQNKALREALQNGSLSVHAYFQELLRLVYRLIFLLTIEERGLLHPESTSEESKLIYTEGYSVRKLRDRAIKRNAYDRFGDLWEVLKIVFKAANHAEPKLGMPALGGLFSDSKTPNLDQCYLENRSLLGAVYHFTWLKENSGVSRVNWRDMGPEELGSVYESLLELIPRLSENGHRFTFASESESKGNERKLTGSYYTPDSLVQSLLDTALEPVVEQTIKAHPKDTIEALLKLKVIDPACGSGHFLLAAARRLAAHIARIEVDGTPSEKDYRKALREVIGHCIYGVDLNPMAIELCKVALWLEAVEPGKPLTFLDHHIKCGNSLLGVTPKLLKEGIPDAAFSPITGDDKKVCSELKKRNKKERESSNRNLFGDIDGFLKLGNLLQTITDLNSLEDNNIEDLRTKEHVYHQFLESGVYKNTKLYCDAWCSAFVWEKNQNSHLPITHEIFREIEESPFKISPDRRAEINRLADQYNFFHFHLEFPDVFSVPVKDHPAENSGMGWNGGFDVVLGNPPWEKLQTEELQFFSERHPDIASMVGAKRKKEISELKKSNPKLLLEWQNQCRFDAGVISYVRESGLYPLTGLGKFNTFALFSELDRNILSTGGRLGIIVPSGIATDDTTKLYFQDVIEKGSLISLFDFENRSKLFPDIDSRMKFCLLTLKGGKASVNCAEAEFVFFAYGVMDLKDPERRFSLSLDDIVLMNPNTKTCPIFRTKRDSVITKDIYNRVPIFLNETRKDSNFYNPRVWRLFNTTDDSSQFLSFENTKNEKLIPVIEAKTIHQYDHRFATFYRDHNGDMALQSVSNDSKQSPNFEVISRYYVDEKLFKERMPNDLSEKKWFLTARNITNSTNERTVIASIIPRGASCEVTPYIEVSGGAKVSAFLLGLLNSFVLDFIARQKVGGTHLSYFILYQLPILHPENESVDIHFFIKRVVELSFTSSSLKDFAAECAIHCNPFIYSEERRFYLRCELDAAYFHLYKIGRNDVEYIMDTFPIVKRKDEQKYNGEYKTKNTVLEFYDAMAESKKIGKSYQTLLDPPPTDIRVAHLEKSEPTRRSM